MRQRWLGVLLQQVVVLLLLMHLIRLVLVQRRWRRKLLRVLPKMLMVGVLLKLLNPTLLAPSGDGCGESSGWLRDSTFITRESGRIHRCSSSADSAAKV